MQREYWKFYWPLVFMGLAMLLGAQFQNGTLARYPEAVTELAVFALASGIFGFFRAALIFVPQMANVLARSKHAQRVCLSFTIAVSVLLSLLVAILAWTEAGNQTVAALFDLEGERLAKVLLYLRLLMPLLVVDGMRQYLTGLFVQARRTGVVTMLNILALLVTITLLVTGFSLGWSPTITIACAQLTAAGVYLLVALILVAVVYRLPEKAEHEDLTYRETFAFFFPVAITSVMFAFSRPVLYGFVARLSDPDPVLAALRVGLDFGFFFHNPVNQFRNLFVTFGREDLAGVRKFMIRVTVVLGVIMVAVCTSPLLDVVLGDLLKVKGDVLEQARQTVWVLMLIPMIVAFRNYYHGRLLVGRRTNSMAVGGVMRVVAIYLSAWALLNLGWLNHATAALALVLGFLVETVIVLFASRWVLPTEPIAAPVLVEPDDG